MRLPDDWALDADLPCPACRYNLRGLRTPRCVECGTEFRWQSILGVACPRCAQPLAACDDESCPQCRLQLDWPALLSTINPVQFDQYEYAVRPIRAAMVAWGKLMRPRRFWRDVPLERPPVVSRLHRFGLAAIFLFAVGLAVLLIAVSSSFGWGRRASLWLGLTFEALGLCALVLWPPLITAILLPRFTPTLSKFRIRRDQLLRIFMYGRAGVAAAGLILILLVLSWAAYLFTMPTLTWAMGGGWTTPDLAPPMLLYSLPWDVVRLRRGFFEWLAVLEPPPGGMNPPLRISEWFNVAVGLALVTVGWLWWWRYLWVSLVDYLRLDRGNARALFLSTQAIALLCGLIVLCNLPEYGFARLIASWLSPSLW